MVMVLQGTGPWTAGCPTCLTGVLAFSDMEDREITKQPCDSLRFETWEAAFCFIPMGS